MANKFPLIAFIIFSIILIANSAHSTHLRAGEIVAIKTGRLSYEFTLILYRNTDSPVNQPAATVEFGDGTRQTSNVLTTTPLNNNTEKLTFKFTKTFSAPSTYIISFTEFNRNASILNIANSVDVPFYVETKITIDPIIDRGKNSTPVLLVPPIDRGTFGQIYTHAAGAYDADGDSLSFKLVTPRQGKDLDVPGYRQPNYTGNSSTGGPPTFSINPVTGLITWDTPGQTGLFNIAFQITEYRNGVELGYIVRDMQIEIVPSDNTPPKLKIPKNQCFVAGNLIRDTATATNKNLPTLTAFGGAFDLGAVKTLLPPNDLFTQKMVVSWLSTCQDVRQQPYLITFKAENIYATGNLTAIDVWELYINGPTPQLLKPTSEGKNLRLRWKPYTCSNADSIIIMKSNCLQDTIGKDSCLTGNKIEDGFIKAATVSAKDTTWLDNDNGRGLARGGVYSYYIYAKFPPVANGYSLPSKVQYAQLSLDAPVITNVSVLKTDIINGEIEVKWTKAKEIDTTLFPGPYRYEVFRTDQPTPLVSLTNLNDTLFIDKSLNTTEKQYSYFVKFFYNNNILKEISDTASSPFLTGFARKGYRIGLSWSSKVPWDLSQDWQYIYIITDTTETRIDSIKATEYAPSKTYEPGKPIKLRIATKGGYGCPENRTKGSLPYPLINFSQIIEIIPADTNKPCPPVLAVDQPTCKTARLMWQKGSGLFCDSTVVKYNVYVRDSISGNFNFIASTGNLFLNETSGNPIDGCYKVKAVNDLGLESSFSNQVCTQNCPYYELPNVFTPNDDGKNELFKPFDTPKYVESVSIIIYNRWGAEVFRSTRDIYINWDAKNVPDGLYYYNATVRFRQPGGGFSEEKRNGWIEVIR